MADGELQGADSNLKYFAYFQMFRKKNQIYWLLKLPYTKW